MSSTAHSTVLLEKLSKTNVAVWYNFNSLSDMTVHFQIPMCGVQAHERWHLHVEIKEAYH
jgi:hypothetical protein